MTFSNFTDFFGELEWLALLVAGLAVVVLGWLWYGPIFGKAWAAAEGQPYDSGMPEPGVLVQGYIQFFLYGIGLAYFVTAAHVMFQNPASFETLLVTSLVLAFFIVGVTLASQVIWADGNWTSWLINTGFWFLAAALSSWIVLDLMA